MNYSRYVAWKADAKLLQKLGFELDATTVESLNRSINYASSRGDLGRLQKVAPELNAILFSPKRAAATVEALLDPRNFTSPQAAILWGRNWAAWTATQLAVVTTSALVGNALTPEKNKKAAWDTIFQALSTQNPLSSEFGKGKIGQTVFDFGDSELQVLRFLYQFTTGQKYNVTTGNINQANRLDIAMNMARTKDSPLAGFVADMLKGRSYSGSAMDIFDPTARKLQIGDVVTPVPQVVTDSMTTLLMPIAAQSLLQGFEEEGLIGVAKHLPAVFGAGVTTYDPAKLIESDFYNEYSSLANRRKELNNMVGNPMQVKQYIANHPEAAFASSPTRKNFYTSKTYNELAKTEKAVLAVEDKIKMVQSKPGLSDSERQKAVDNYEKQKVALMEATLKKVKNPKLLQNLEELNPE